MFYNSLQFIGHAGRFVDQREGPIAGNHLSMIGGITTAVHGVNIIVEVTANIVFLKSLVILKKFSI